jgi:hypothetical protein
MDREVELVFGSRCGVGAARMIMPTLLNTRTGPCLEYRSTWWAEELSLRTQGLEPIQKLKM